MKPAQNTSSSPIIQSANRAARNVLTKLGERVEKAILEASRQGALSGSMSMFHIAKICKAGYREACEAASVRIAEALGSTSVQLADDLDNALGDLQDTAIEIYPFKTWQRHGGSFEDLGKKILSELEAKWLEEKNHVVEDLRIGIAGGVNVKKQHNVSIDNRGGAAQIAVDSAGTVQSVQGNLTGQFGIDLSEVSSLLSEVRKALENTNLTEEARVELDDAIVVVEREIEQPQLDEGRLKRFLTRIAAKGGALAAPVVQKLVEAYLKSKGWLT